MSFVPFLVIFISLFNDANFHVGRENTKNGRNKKFWYLTTFIHQKILLFKTNLTVLLPASHLLWLLRNKSLKVLIFVTCPFYIDNMTLLFGMKTTFNPVFDRTGVFIVKNCTFSCPLHLITRSIDEVINFSSISAFY